MWYVIPTKDVVCLNIILKARGKRIYISQKVNVWLLNSLGHFINLINKMMKTGYLCNRQVCPKGVKTRDLYYFYINTNRRNHSCWFGMVIIKHSIL